MVLHPERCWPKIWDTTLYEPDFVTGFSLIGGAVEAYNNQIYWGLMQIPSTGILSLQHGVWYSQSV